MPTPTADLSERNTPAVETDQIQPPLARALWSLLFWGLCALLLFGPLAFGAVEDWSTLVLRAGAVLLLCVWGAIQILQRELEVTRNPLFLPMAGFAALVGLQLVAGRSAYLYATLSDAMDYVAYGILFFLTVQVLQRREVSRLGRILLWFGFLYALFAVAQDLSGTDKLYWLRKPRQGGAPYGAYVNRNHYAGLMEMLLPFALVAGLSRAEPGGRRALVLFAALIMAGSIFLSGSRGGLASLLVQLVLLSAMSSRKLTGGRVAVTMALVAVLAVGFVLWLDRGRMVGRIENLQEVRPESGEWIRWEIIRDSGRMAAQRPILGFGLNTFPIVYPQYRSFYTSKFINEAHNDYLQVLVEMGALGLLAVLAFIYLLYRSALRELAHWQVSTRQAFRLAALTGCTGILIHSFLDFNLHIPANAALYFVLCAVASSPLPRITRAA